jgi:hypothetical protein
VLVPHVARLALQLYGPLDILGCLRLAGCLTQLVTLMESQPHTFMATG